MKPEGLLRCLQEPAIGSYSESYFFVA